LPPKEVTTAVKLPVLVGSVPKVIVNWVAVALSTVPTAPLLLLKVTVLLAAVVSNPEPAMVMVLALIARLLVFNVTIGAATMVAT
jgi:hypothetical protein